MTDLYQNKIVNRGSMAKAFLEEKMIILFGSGAPPELEDYCYIINIVPVNGEIKPGQSLYVNDERYLITAVGNSVKQNLSNLGHISIRFNGLTEAELPGTLYVENKTLPELSIGTELKISE